MNEEINIQDMSNDEIIELLHQKREGIIKGNISGYILFEQGNPIGICWRELVSNYYGNG